MASLALPPAVRESSSMRIVNTTMRELSWSFPGSEPIAFFCECHSPNCFSAVWVSPDVFDATVAGHRDWMLLEGHKPSARWHATSSAPSPAARTALRILPDLDGGTPRPLEKQRSFDSADGPGKQAGTRTSDRTPLSPGQAARADTQTNGGRDGNH
jgi:hypothetical protein